MQAITREFEFAGWRCRAGSTRHGLPTYAQAQVIAGLAAGLTQKEIAKLRGVSPNTVKAACCVLYSMLKVNRATAAVATAIRRGWIAPLILALLFTDLHNKTAGRVRQPTRTRETVSAMRTARRMEGGAA